VPAAYRVCSGLGNRPETRRGLKILCRWFDSVPGHQGHTSRNANPYRLALSFLKFAVLGSDLYPVIVVLGPVMLFSGVLVSVAASRRQPARIDREPPRCALYRTEIYVALAYPVLIKQGDAACY
jgi:hypothetical protein